MNKCIGILFCFCSMVCAVYAESEATVVQNKLSAIQTLHAHFTQTIQSQQRSMSSSSGEMVLVRPDKFRWQTKRPMAQTVIADGKQLWIYDVELEQVTVSRQSQNLGIAGALFLSQDPNSVQQNFAVKASRQGSIEIFDLHAKSSRANFERVRLVFEKNQLTTIELYDQLGQHSTLRFSKIVMNHSESPALFQFHIPPGVDVVYQ